jgi:hypothetical protein
VTVGLTNAAKQRRREATRAANREKYGPDWQPERCQWCARSERQEPIRKAALTLPPDEEHPRAMTLFLRIGVRPKPDGTVVKTGATVRWNGTDRRVPEFRPATADDPPELPRFRIHNARNCVDDDLEPI